MTTLARAHRTWRSGVRWDGATPRPLRAWRTDHNQTGWTLPVLASTDTTNRTAMWARVVETGATLVRAEADWSVLQPSNGGSAGPGANDTLDATALANLDAFVDDAENAGCHIWWTITYTASWANGSAGNKNYPPSRELDSTNLAPDFANFVWLIVDRYATRNPGVVVAVSPWNEPNVAATWKTAPSATDYAYVMTGAYQAVKAGTVAHRSDRAAYPDVLVVAGSTAADSGVGGDLTPLQFVTALLAVDSISFDHLDHHAWSWQQGPTDANFMVLHDIWAALKAVGRSDSLIWCGTIGAPSRPDASGTDASSPYGVGGYTSGSPGWNTDPTAITYTLAGQRVTETFAAWRGADYYDLELLKHTLGPIVWTELADASSGIGSNWAVSASNYRGIYEQGAGRWNGAAKTGLADVWITLAAPDTTAPTAVAVILPGDGTTVTDEVTIAVAATDDRDTYVETVEIFLDGTLLGRAAPIFGYLRAWDTTTVANGLHTLQARATDNAGNVTLSPLVTVTVSNSTVVTATARALASVITSRPRWDVLVRDADLEFVALLDDWSSLQFVTRHNMPGAWTIDCADNAACQILMADGAGIVIERSGTPVFSGLRKSTTRKRAADGTRSVTFAGVDDFALTAAAVVKPQPFTLAPPYSTAAYDTRVGPASSVVLGYIDANLAAGATPDRARARVTVGVDPVVGSTVRFGGRYHNLGDVIRRLATISTPELAVRALQVGDQIIFTADTVRDVSRSVVFAIEAGTITEAEWAETAATANYAYVAGQGVGTARTVYEAAAQASIIGDGRAEVFIDQRDTNDLTQLAQSAQDAFASGAASYNLTMTAIPGGGGVWPDDWTTGDLVTVSIEGTQIIDSIREIEVRVDASGETVTPRIGTADQNNPRASALFKRLARAERRIAELETAE